MQTFLPYADFKQTARVLDYRRLGKQRVEAKQILMALRSETKGWVNHPATRMWAGHEPALIQYGLDICHEWVHGRGYKDTLTDFFLEQASQFTGPIVMPKWIGDTEFHLAHQSNLVRKDPVYYGAMFPGVQDDLEYVWPTNDGQEVRT